MWDLGELLKLRGILDTSKLKKVVVDKLNAESYKFQRTKQWGSEMAQSTGLASD